MKRILFLVLVLVMVPTLAPTAAFANPLAEHGPGNLRMGTYSLFFDSQGNEFQEAVRPALTLNEDGTFVMVINLGWTMGRVYGTWAMGDHSTVVLTNEYAVVWNPDLGREVSSSDFGGDIDATYSFMVTTEGDLVNLEWLGVISDRMMFEFGGPPLSAVQPAPPTAPAPGATGTPRPGVYTVGEPFLLSLTLNADGTFVMDFRTELMTFPIFGTWTAGDYVDIYPPMTTVVLDVEMTSELASADVQPVYHFFLSADGALANLEPIGTLPPNMGFYFSERPVATAPATGDLSSASLWAHADITSAIAAGLVPQNLQSQFTQATTRAEFAALATALYEAATGREITERMAFNDTTDINVQKMGGLGVVTGVGGGNFAPNDTLTREQASTMLSRLANVIGRPLNAQDAAFADHARISSWALESVGQMQATGVMGGVGNNQFAPQGVYTREQSIVTMLRLYGIVR